MIGVRSFGPGISEAKAAFLDTPKVMRAVDRGRRRALARSGGYIRQVARRSIRPRRGPSPAGQPPHSHTGLLRDHVYFGYDESARSVVVGPAALNRGTRAPETLEFGGRTEKPKWWRGTAKYIRIKARPYMAPALAASKDVIARNFKDQAY